MNYFYLISIFVIVYVCIFLAFTKESSKNRTNVLIKPNLQYKIGEREYKVPDLPVKGTAFLLEEQFLLLMREMYERVDKAFEECKIEYWISGGTLVGFQRHKTFLPWDDDLDAHTHEKHKKFMFTPEFRNTLNKHGLETLFMLGSTEDFSYYKGGLRIKMLEHLNPVMDIFFVTDVSDNKISKIENWVGDDFMLNFNETWQKEDIYPIKNETIDGLPIKLPNNPHNVLAKQYSPNYGDEIHCGHPPHTIVYDMLRFIWKNEPN